MSMVAVEFVITIYTDENNVDFADNDARKEINAFIPRLLDVTNLECEEWELKINVKDM